MPSPSWAFTSLPTPQFLQSPLSFSDGAPQDPTRNPFTPSFCMLWMISSVAMASPAISLRLVYTFSSPVQTCIQPDLQLLTPYWTPELKCFTGSSNSLCLKQVNHLQTSSNPAPLSVLLFLVMTTTFAPTPTQEPKSKVRIILDFSSTPSGN